MLKVSPVHMREIQDMSKAIAGAKMRGKGTVEREFAMKLQGYLLALVSDGVLSHEEMRDMYHLYRYEKPTEMIRKGDAI